MTSSSSHHQRPQQQQQSRRRVHSLFPCKVSRWTLIVLLVIGLFVSLGLAAVLAVTVLHAAHPGVKHTLWEGRDGLRRLLWRLPSPPSPLPAPVGEQELVETAFRCVVLEGGPAHVISVGEDTADVCERGDVLDDGCCSLSASEEESPTCACSRCTPSGCCSSFSDCVACCLQPSNAVLWGEVDALQRQHITALGGDLPLRGGGDRTAALTRPRLQWLTFCERRCRTASSSTLHESAYRGLNRYCMGVLRPPLDEL